MQYHQVFEMASTGSFLVLAYIAYHLQLNSLSDRGWVKQLWPYLQLNTFDYSLHLGLGIRDLELGR